MGFEPHQILRAQSSGAQTISQAVDYLTQSNMTADTSQDWPVTTLSKTDYQPLPTQNPSQFNSTSTSLAYPNPHQTNPHNSIDLNNPRMDVSSPQPPKQIGPLSAHDTEMQRAMELSAKEHEQGEQEELKKAIELSKQAGIRAASAGQDPNFYRVVQQTYQLTQRDITNSNAAWQSQPFSNPKEGLRSALEHPVGLRNIGNTCYLNSLLQVYYHLPNFRTAIMSFRAPEHVTTVTEPISESLPVENDTHIMSDQGDSNVQARQLLDDGLRPLMSEENISDKSDNHAAEQSHPPQEATNTNAVEFVVELQRLFAAMSLGNENCVDPTDVMRALRDSDGRPIVVGTQQDASEFNQLFMEMVEKGLSCDSSQAVCRGQAMSLASQPDSFTSDLEPRKMMDKQDSPEETVKNMFTLKFLQEIKPCQSPRQVAAIGQKPVQTNGETTSIIVTVASKGERNLYGGLDDYAYDKVDYRGSAAVTVVTSEENTSNADTLVEEEKSASTSVENENVTMLDVNEHDDDSSAIKSLWFTRLPPVVVIYLQRTDYNPKTSQPEKVHDRYDFPPELALDRYMEANREASEKANKQVRALRRRRKRIMSLLDEYRRFPVQKNPVASGGIDQVQMQGEAHTGTNAQLNGPVAEEFFSAGERLQKRLQQVLDPTSQLFTVNDVAKEDVEMSMKTISKILDHDRRQCESYERELRDMNPESEFFGDLNHMRYFLHAVLVHEGAPDSGHYWTFIRNWNAIRSDEEWLRLSDSSVSFVKESDMFLSSVGGNGKASAYCIMYTANPNIGKNEIAEESKALLPQQRIDEVEKRCSDFAREFDASQMQSIQDQEI